MTNDKKPDATTNRKGVYQALDANGNVTADERWRLASTRDGGMRIDMETVRIAPFAEPRTESATLELGPQLEWRRLAIHALGDRRESRVDFTTEYAELCWRYDETSRTREYSWTSDCEIDYNSALFNMLTVRRLSLKSGEIRALNVIVLDSVTFEPRWVRQVYGHMGMDERPTRFGVLRLDHFKMDFGGDGVNMCHFWSDQAGVVFDYETSTGSGFRLAGVNFPI